MAHASTTSLGNGKHYARRATADEISATLGISRKDRAYVESVLKAKGFLFPLAKAVPAKTEGKLRDRMKPTVERRRADLELGIAQVKAGTAKVP